ncbi:MAG: roadblock/LC7 domain-containing protein [Candidatus Electrothrix sp. YB6]
MNIRQKLSRLAEIDGFAGAALFTPDGRLLVKCEPVDINIELLGSLANNVLRTAEKVSRDMSCGRSHFTFMHTEKVLILLRCLNEGKNPLRAEPGRCHIHLILFIDNPESLGIAKIEISKVIESLAANFRAPAKGSRQQKKKAPASQKTADRTENRAEKLPEQQGKKPLNDVACLLNNEQVNRAFDSLLA